MSYQYDISACLPCAGRPQRTRRMLLCLQAQTKRNIELLLIGDACKDFQEMISSQWFADWSKKFEAKGNKLFCKNLSQKGGGYGSDAINLAIRIATGKYFCFLGNDDMIEPEHLQYYFESIDDDFPIPVDFVYNKTMLISCGNGFFERDPKLRYGCVGHSELVIRTSFLKKMPPHDKEHGHDWRLIENMMLKRPVTYKKGDTPFPTYYVMGLPGSRETVID